MSASDTRITDPSATFAYDMIFSTFNGCILLPQNIKMTAWMKSFKSHLLNTLKQRSSTTPHRGNLLSWKLMTGSHVSIMKQEKGEPTLWHALRPVPWATDQKIWEKGLQIVNLECEEQAMGWNFFPLLIIPLFSQCIQRNRTHLTFELCAYTWVVSASKRHHKQWPHWGTQLSRWNSVTLLAVS